MDATINHPGMTREWFVEAAYRATSTGCRLLEQSAEMRRRKIVFVTSGTVNNLTYRVTRTTCTCQGHERTGHCKHRALAIMTFDVIGYGEHAVASLAA